MQIFSRVKTILEKKSILILIAIIFRLTLELSYVEFVHPLFDYEGFGYDPGTLVYFESWIIFFAIVFLAPAVVNKVSDFLFGYLIYAYVVPMVILFGLTNGNRIHLYIALIGVLVLGWTRNGRTPKFDYPTAGRISVFWISSVALIIGLAWIIFAGGERYFNLDLELVYDFRDASGAILDVGPMAYLMSWIPAVFAPALLVLALLRKNIIVGVLVLVLHVLWYGVTSHKSVLFSPVLILFVWFVYRHSRALSPVPIIFSLAVILTLANAIYNEEYFAASLFIRRTFFVPSHLAFAYYDYFSQYDYVFWSNSITSLILKYPYPLPPPQLISDYLGGQGHANVTFLATGFMHAGVLGIVFYGFLVGRLFNLIDGLSASGLPQWSAISIVLIPSHSLLTSADLPTAFLTHGVGLAIFILYMLRISPKEVHNEGGSKK